MEQSEARAAQLHMQLLASSSRVEELQQVRTGLPCPPLTRLQLVSCSGPHWLGGQQSLVLRLQTARPLAVVRAELAQAVLPLLAPAALPGATSGEPRGLNPTP